jgi:hypothetical protein
VKKIIFVCFLLILIFMREAYAQFNHTQAAVGVMSEKSSMLLHAKLPYNQFSLCGALRQFDVRIFRGQTMLWQGERIQVFVNYDCQLSGILGLNKELPAAIMQSSSEELRITLAEVSCGQLFSLPLHLALHGDKHDTEHLHSTRDIRGPVVNCTEAENLALCDQDSLLKTSMGTFQPTPVYYDLPIRDTVLYGLRLGNRVGVWHVVGQLGFNYAKLLSVEGSIETDDGVLIGVNSGFGGPRVRIGPERSIEVFHGEDSLNEKELILWIKYVK